VIDLLGRKKALLMTTGGVRSRLIIHHTATRALPGHAMRSPRP
jgi:hypothetical protein